MTCIPIKNGIVCLAKTDFNCPVCGKQYTESDYTRQLDKSRHGLIYKRCKGCGKRIGITTDMHGDVRVWEKK
jgi:uncharacterized C2H2 Zn-finger protein